MSDRITMKLGSGFARVALRRRKRWFQLLRPWVVLSCLLVAGRLQAGEVKDVLASIGQVLAGEDDGTGNAQIRLEGSGVVVSPEGIVVTNCHVVSDGGRFYPAIFFNLLDPAKPYAPPDRSRLYRTEVILKDVDLDLVLLRIIADGDGNPLPSSQTFKAVELADSRVLSFLDEIYMVGFPKAGGSTVTITRGQVSGKEELEDWIKTDAQVTHGNSGGAAVDKSGRLIGVPVAHKDIFVTRYIALRGLLLNLLDTYPQIQAVGVESPPFGESFSEGLYGLFVYVCEAVYLHRKDVVFFDPQTVKRLVKMDPSIRRGSMDKRDMVEAARVDAGILKGKFDHNEADAYHVARFAARFWEFVNGVLKEEDLVPSELSAFYKTHKFKQGAKAGKTIITGLAFRENARFFRFSKIPQEV